MWQVIDDFLTPEALEIRCKNSAWNPPSGVTHIKFGYISPIPQHGFASNALFGVAHRSFRVELGEAFDQYQLAQWWAFVYDAKLPGTDIHGDDADFSFELLDHPGFGES